MRDRAREKVKEIMREHRPEPLDGDVQKELKALIEQAEGKAR